MELLTPPSHPRTQSPRSQPFIPLRANASPKKGISIWETLVNKTKTCLHRASIRQGVTADKQDTSYVPHYTAVYTAARTVLRQHRTETNCIQQFSSACSFPSKAFLMKEAAPSFTLV